MKSQSVFLPEDILIPHFGDKPIVGVEIGTGAGGGSAAMLLLIPNLKLYCIDAWKHMPGHLYEAEFYSQELHDKQYELAIARLKLYPPERSVVLRMTSDEAIFHVPSPIHFLWIDGDHRYEQVKKDIVNWMPKIIKPGGLISGHDYIQAPGVTQAVDEIFGKNIRTGDDFTWWVEFR